MNTDDTRPSPPPLACWVASLLLSACGALAPSNGDVARAAGGEAEPNDVQEEATLIGERAFVHGGVGGIGDDRDWFAIVPTANGRLALEVEELGNARAHLAGTTMLDDQGAVLTIVPTAPGAGPAVVRVEIGRRYLILIQSATLDSVSYVLRTRFEEDRGLQAGR